MLLSNGSSMVVSQGKLRAASPTREDSGNDSDGTATGKQQSDGVSSYSKRPTLEDFEMIKTIGERCRVVVAFPQRWIRIFFLIKGGRGRETYDTFVT